jgi:hypothetical protein
MKSEKSHGENAAAQVYGHADGDFGLDGEVDQAKIGTSYDERDMWRIGRRQELNVSSIQRIYTRLTSADSFEAKLPIRIDLGIHLCADEHLGSRPDVSKPRTCSERHSGFAQRSLLRAHQWRSPRHDLDLPGCYLWIWHSHPLHGGDVVHVSSVALARTVTTNAVIGHQHLAVSIIGSLSSHRKVSKDFSVTSSAGYASSAGTLASRLVDTYSQTC